MPLIPFGDKCLQSSITTTTGPYQVTTSVGAFKTWRSQFADASEAFYYAENSDGTIWEEGFGLLAYGAPDTITRTAVLQSSTGAAVDWSGVTVYIFSAPVARANPGRYVNAKTMWVPEMRRPTTAVGAANKTIAAADVAGIFTLDNSALTRSVTLPALSAVGEGFSFRFMGLSNLSLMSLIPNGTDAIDFSGGGTTVKFPGKTWIDVWSDGTQWRTSFRYGERTKLLELTASAAASIDTGGSIFPSWVNTLHVEVDLFPSVDGANFSIQLYDSGGTLKSGAADYNYVYNQTDSAPGNTPISATAASATFAANVDNGGANWALNGHFDCENLQAGTQRMQLLGQFIWLASNGTTAVINNWAAHVAFNGAGTGVKILPSSGNLTGAARIYASA